MNEHFSEEQLKNAKATLPNTEFQDEVLKEQEERGAKLSPEVCKAIKDGAYVSVALGECYANPKIIKAEF